MPTRLARLIENAIRGLRPLTNNMSLEAERAGQDFLGRVETRHIPDGINVVRSDVGDIPAEWFHPEGAADDAAIIYFHGGAYMAGSLVSNRVLALELATSLGMNVLSFEYRLAPENPYPAALVDAMRIYRSVLELDVPAQRISFIGDSAGGGLLCAAALRAKADGIELPSSLVMLSPWVDLTLSGETYETLKDRDPLLTKQKLKRAAEYYVGDADAHDPYISPVFGDFHGFPPALIHVGTHEVLLDDARMLAKAMLRDGAEATIEEWQGMWHVWHAFDIKETRLALKRISEYVCGNMGMSKGDE